MVFRVQNTVRYWYGSDITHAVSVWNNSSYKGTSTAFLFDDDGNTNAATDYPDLNNVVGIKNMPSHIAAQAHTYFYGNGEIYECDMNINSISVLNIQPHSSAGANDLCVRNALCHEFGHALGLSHMDKNSVGSWVEYIADTMFYDIEYGEHKKEDLECDDKWGIWYTYDSGSVSLPTAPSVHDLLHPIFDRELPLTEKGGIPTVTELIGNYPNPFNPETWIAYTLAEGQAIRVLELGRKPAGVYVEKESAAYWDGKTDTGEQVSSGMYFYSLITDSSIYTKRMVIVK